MHTYKSYLTGFIISVALTLLAFFAVQNRILMPSYLTVFILISALLQVVVQLVFFLHLYEKGESSENFLLVSATIVVILILVVGSLWIMNHLNYNMTPEAMNKELMKSENLKPQIHR